MTSAVNKMLMRLAPLVGRAGGVSEGRASAGGKDEKGRKEERRKEGRKKEKKKERKKEMKKERKK